MRLTSKYSDEQDVSHTILCYTVVKRYIMYIHTLLCFINKMCIYIYNNTKLQSRSIYVLRVYRHVQQFARVRGMH